jgi:hypothetical protein
MAGDTRTGHRRSPYHDHRPSDCRYPGERSYDRHDLEIQSGSGVRLSPADHRCSRVRGYLLTPCAWGLPLPPSSPSWDASYRPGAAVSMPQDGGTVSMDADVDWQSRDASVRVINSAANNPRKP